MFLAWIKCLGNVQSGEISKKDCLESYIFPFTSLQKKAKHLPSSFVWYFKIFMLLVIKAGANMNLWDGTSSRHCSWGMCLPAYIYCYRNHGFHKSKKCSISIILVKALWKCTKSDTDWLHGQEVCVNMQNDEVSTAHSNIFTKLRAGTISASPENQVDYNCQNTDSTDKKTDLVVTFHAAMF